ncbi:MAG: RidA family protein [Chitinophagaceae bacterium]|nr:RidA family protein [Chitinophagaceae bacterium]
MKKLILIFLLCPLISTAQKTVPRFENDTVYTTSGYKIYKGQILHLDSGTAENRKFRFIKLQNGGLHLENNRYQKTSILVRKLSDYKVSGLGNHYIGILGTLTYKDGSTAKINIDLNFDRAIENFTGLPGELIVPEEFKNKKALQNDPLIIKLVNPPALSTPKGYSHAAVIDLGNCSMIIISGQIALDSSGNLIGKGDIANQTEQVFLNIKNVLSPYGGNMDNVVKLGIYMLDISQVQVMRDVRNKFINLKQPPASTLVQVSKLAREDLLIEIEATAIIPKK